MALRATLDVPLCTGRDGAIDHVVKLQDGGSQKGACRLLHAGEKSSWYLANDKSGVYVAYIPDVSTGQDVRRLEIADVLVAGGPERDELLRLIGTLVY
jgi:hypothetical protein